MVEKKGSIWDILAWIVLVGIFIWLILKTVGIINTPLWFLYAPLYGAVYLAGWQMHKLDGIGKEVEGLKKFQSETIREIHNIKLDCARNHGK